MVTRGQNQLLKRIETVILSKASEAEAILIKIAVPQHSSCLSTLRVATSRLLGLCGIRHPVGSRFLFVYDVRFVDLYLSERCLDQNRRQV